MGQKASLHGFANDWHLVHIGVSERSALVDHIQPYRSLMTHLKTFATRGAGAITMEGAAVAPEGRIGPQDLGIWSDEHVPSLQRVVAFSHSQGTKIGIQLVHGGPGGQSRRGYSAMIQHLVNHGYGVFAANNRGSSGYGKTFFHMDDRRHGEPFR